MKETPQAIRGETVNVGEKSWKGTSMRQPPKQVESTRRSGPASFDDKVEPRGGHRVAGRGQVCNRAHHFPSTWER